MKTLNPKILKKLAEDLKLAPQTVKNSISKLARKYPGSTPNARAHLYAEKNGLSVYRMLDKDDKKSFAKPGGTTVQTVANHSPIRIIQVSKNPDSPLNKLWVQLLLAFCSFLFTGVLAGTIAQILGIYLATKWGLTN